MIKVLNIISDTNIGGAGNLLLNMLYAYDRSSFDMSVAMPRGGMLKERICDLGIEVYELDCIRDKSFDLSAVRPIMKLIHRVQPDIVHTHGALSGRIAAKRCGKQVVFTRHSGFDSNPVFKKGIGKAFFSRITERYADRIIATSVLCRDDLVECGVSDSKITVILNGVKQMRILSNAERKELRIAYGFGADEFIAGIVARVEPYKGQSYVIEAARILKDEGKKVRILVAGTGSDEEAIIKRSEELGLGDTVVFLGFVNDVAPIYNMLDVQINASFVETSSLSLLEGMSIGLPAVASMDSGNPWVIKDGINGMLFKSRDPASLASHIGKLYDSPDLLHSLSEGSMEIYEKEFTAERLAKATQAVYQELAGDRT